MLHGEIWWVDFEPSVGGEIRKKRPAVIISNDISNRYLNRVQVVPLSSKTDNLYPCETLIYFGETRSKAMADQLTTVSKHRLISRGGKVTLQEMESIKQIIRLQLDLI
jgi:mRNA interferase MazF